MLGGGEGGKGRGGKGRGGGGEDSIYHLYYQTLTHTGGTQTICLPDGGVTISLLVHLASNTKAPPPLTPLEETLT